VVRSSSASVVLDDSSSVLLEFVGYLEGNRQRSFSKGCDVSRFSSANTGITSDESSDHAVSFVASLAAAVLGYVSVVFSSRSISTVFTRVPETDATEDGPVTPTLTLRKTVDDWPLLKTTLT
jgi:hypothetical protein